MKALVIEDDIQLNKAIKTFLNLKNYDVTSSFDGEKAILTIDANEFDIYIVDINLPNVNGLDIVKYIRQKNKDTPIIMVTASSEVDNFTRAYENGCSEYIKKPFHLKELDIRMQRLLDIKSNHIVEIDDNLKFDLKFNELFVDGEPIKIRKKEKRFLHLLISNLNHTISNEEIFNYVWENEIKENYPLRQLVAALRKKIKLKKNYIISDIGVGYRIEK